MPNGRSDASTARDCLEIGADGAAAIGRAASRDRRATIPVRRVSSMSKSRRTHLYALDDRLRDRLSVCSLAAVGCAGMETRFPADCAAKADRAPACRQTAESACVSREGRIGKRARHVRLAAQAAASREAARGSRPNPRVVSERLIRIVWSARRSARCGKAGTTRTDRETRLFQPRRTNAHGASCRSRFTSLGSFRVALSPITMSAPPSNRLMSSGSSSGWSVKSPCITTIASRRGYRVRREASRARASSANA